MNQPIIQIIYLIFLAFIGSAIGSFLSVFIHRHKHQEKGIINGRSQCPKCHQKLTLPDLIPIFSYIFNLGKCRHCQKKISQHYFLLELTTSLTFLTIGIFNPLNQLNSLFTISQLLFQLIIFTFLIGILFYDFLYQEIPDLLNLPLIIISIIGLIIFPIPNGYSALLALSIAIVFFGGQIIVSQGKWLGTGDLLLSISMAFILGWQKFLVALIATYFIGATIATFLLIHQKTDKKSKIAFAPFLILGTFIAFFQGETIIDWYIKLTYLY